MARFYEVYVAYITEHTEDGEQVRKILGKSTDVGELFTIAMKYQQEDSVALAPLTLRQAGSSFYVLNEQGVVVTIEPYTLAHMEIGSEDYERWGWLKQEYDGEVEN